MQAALPFLPPDVPAQADGTQRLSAIPMIGSLAGLDDALADLVVLDALEADINAEYRAAVEEATCQKERRLVIHVEGVSMTAADRRKALHFSIDNFVEKHRAKVFAAGTKTARFNHGTLSLKAAPFAVGFKSGQTEKSVVATITEKSKLRAQLEGLLSHLFRAKQPLSKFLRTKIELNKSGIGELFKAGLIDAKILSPLGIKPLGGQDVLSIEPAAPQLTSQSTEAVA